MSADLDKARAAVEAARHYTERIKADSVGQLQHHLRIAEIHAAIAHAEAGERQADALEAILRHLNHIGINP